MEHHIWSTLGDFFAGWVGGVFGLLLGYPGDTIKVRQQTVGGTLMGNIRYTWINQGFFGFYRGFWAPFLIIGPSNAIFFGVYGICLRILEPSTKDRIDVHNPHWMKHSLAAGGLAGFFQVLITCPAELIKTVMQTSEGKFYNKQSPHPRYASSKHAVKSIYKHRGIAGLYKGFIPNLWRDVPNSAIFTLVYEWASPRSEEASLMHQVVAGGLAGVVSWTSTLPFDVVKSRLQSDSTLNPIYKGMIDCFYKSYKAEGLRVFCKGFWLISARAFPVNAAILLGYEHTRSLFKL